MNQPTLSEIAMPDEVKLLPCERGYELANWLSGWLQDKTEDFSPATHKQFRAIVEHLHATRAIEATRPTDEVVERAVSEAVDNVRNVRTKSGFGEMLDEEALMLLMLNELHANMPEVDRPMSMSDLSDEQAQRARNAVRKVLVASMLSAPAGRFSSLTELENAMKDAASDGGERTEAEELAMIAAAFPPKPKCDADGKFRPGETLKEYFARNGTPADPEAMAEYERSMREDTIPAIERDLKAQQRAAHFLRLGIPDPDAETRHD